MSVDACVDIETFDVSPTAVILSVGVTKFDPLGGLESSLESQLWNLDIDAQFKAGRTASIGTLQFWRQQSNDAWYEATLQSDALGVDEFREQLTSFVKDVKGKVWAKDPHFDMVILRDYLGGEENMTRSNFSRFYKWRSFRTIHDAAGMVAPEAYETMTNQVGVNPRAHSAVADAEHEARTIQAAHQALMMAAG